MLSSFQHCLRVLLVLICHFHSQLKYILCPLAKSQLPRFFTLVSGRWQCLSKMIDILLIMIASPLLLLSNSKPVLYSCCRTMLFSCRTAQQARCSRPASCSLQNSAHCGDSCSSKAHCRTACPTVAGSSCSCVLRLCNHQQINFFDHFLKSLATFQTFCPDGVRIAQISNLQSADCHLGNPDPIWAKCLTMQNVCNSRMYVCFLTCATCKKVWHKSYTLCHCLQMGVHFAHFQVQAWVAVRCSVTVSLHAVKLLYTTTFQWGVKVATHCCVIVHQCFIQDQPDTTEISQIQLAPAVTLHCGISVDG